MKYTSQLLIVKIYGRWTKEPGNHQYVCACNTGLFYLGKGKHDEAFDWFNIGIGQHDGLLLFLKQKFKVLPGLQ